ncbi:MAG TPA: hypothetical protein VFD70_02245 [Anaerolineae bacterium]|nr:hypothetical protein [Anaerolineae bacterium]
MNQRDAVIQVMQANGGYATLGYLYQHVLDVPGVKWDTKTPFASMRRIVQDPKHFFKIRPGLWALKGWEKKIPSEILAQAQDKSPAVVEFNHSYYQGLLVEIGNLKKFVTFVPNQDKHKKFLNTPLAKLATLGRIYPFTYDHLVRRAQAIDVTWFNERKMPDTFFEVEHSTNIHNSLLKFVDLQDFHAHFYIVADKARANEYASKIAHPAFKPVSGRVKFLSYDTLSALHAKTAELAAVESRL